MSTAEMEETVVDSQVPIGMDGEEPQVAPVAKEKSAEQLAKEQKVKDDRAKAAEVRKAENAKRIADKAKADKVKADAAAAASKKKDEDDAAAEKKKQALAEEKKQRDAQALVTREQKEKADREFALATTEPPYTPAPLTPEQAARRKMLEESADAEYQTAALAAVRMTENIQTIIKEGLHHDYPSSAAYMADRWKITQNYATRKLNFGNFVGQRIEILGKVQESDSVLAEEPVFYQYPENPSLVRPLMSLDSDAKKHQAWDAVVADCKKRTSDPNKPIRPTAKDVSRAVDEVKGKGITPVGLDAIIEKKDQAAGKAPKGGGKWRAKFRAIVFVEDKGRRYTAEKLSDSSFRGEVYLLETDGRPQAKPLVSNKFATNEAVLAFWDKEKATFDAADDAEFENSKVPTPEFFDPKTGQDTPAPPQTDADAPGTAWGEDDI